MVVEGSLKFVYRLGVHYYLIGSNFQVMAVLFSLPISLTIYDVVFSIQLALLTAASTYGLFFPSAFIILPNKGPLFSWYLASALQPSISFTQYFIFAEVDYFTSVFIEIFQSSDSVL